MAQVQRTESARQDALAQVRDLQADLADATSRLAQVPWRPCDPFPSELSWRRGARNGGVVVSFAVVVVAVAVVVVVVVVFLLL